MYPSQPTNSRCGVNMNFILLLLVVRYQPVSPTREAVLSIQAGEAGRLAVAGTLAVEDKLAVGDSLLEER